MGADLSLPDVQFSPDRTFIVTGGNTGIGYITAKEIAKKGGHVIIACRNTTKAEAAITQMKEEYEKEKDGKQGEKTESVELNVEQMELDLASFSKTMKFIEDFKARNCKLNVLICNAGTVMPEKVLTEDGYETMLQANYLSHVLIILHLLPLLKSSGEDSRIVQVSSDAYYIGKFDVKNVNGDASFSSMFFYGNSKLFQLMSMYWLTRHVKDQSVTINSLHPGFVNTQITQVSFWTRIASNTFARNTQDGAATSITAATDPKLKAQTGLYLKDCKAISTSSFTKNEEKQDELMTYTFQAIDKYLPSDIKEFVNM